MNAREARALTEKSLREAVIIPLVNQVDKQIAKAASEGKNSIVPVFGESVNSDVKNALRKYYESPEQGYTWVDHPDPDPGHPGSRPYTTLSW